MRIFKLLVFSIIFIFFLPLNILRTAVAEEKKLSKVLNVYNWEDYIGPATLVDFEKKFGVEARLKIFEDEEEMISELQSYPEKHDIIITSDNTVRELIEMRLLAEIDLDNIPDIKNIDPKFRNPSYDPGNKHSVPYLWGTTGIAANRRFTEKNANSWSMLWDPKYKGRIAMLDNPDEVIAAALKYLGYSINTTDPSQLEEARQKLLEQNSLGVLYLDPITIRTKLISGELWVAHIYSGEGMYAIDKNKEIEYFVPKEGATLWVDCLCVPRDARHKYTAEVFINYILDPVVSSKIVNYLWYSNCNKAARDYTNKEILQSPSLYPPGSILDKCEFFQKGGTEEERNRTQQIYNKIWSELQLKEN